MAILDDLLEAYRSDLEVKEIYTCVYWTMVSSITWGMSSTFRDEGAEHPTVKNAGNLRGQSVWNIANYSKSDSLLEASIGMAALNSIIEIDQSLCTEMNAFDVIANKGSGKNIAVIGHFPWIPRLKEISKNLWVIEKRPHPGDFPEKLAHKYIPLADVVAITGTAFINHTIDSLLELARGKFIVILGPTSPMTPILFDYGVNVISGIQVTNPRKVIKCITEGAILRQVEGIRLLSMSK